MEREHIPGREIREMCTIIRTYESFKSYRSISYCFWIIRYVKESKESTEGGGSWIMEVIVLYARDLRVYHFVMGWREERGESALKYFKWRNCDMIRFYIKK